MNKIFFLTALFFINFLCEIKAQNMERVRKNIDSLCSPGMHGRGYVSGGDRLAANFLKQQFSEIGLQKFGENYFQHFEMPVNTFPGEMLLEIDGKTMQPGPDFILRAGSESGRGKGEIYRLDTAIFNDKEAQLRLMSEKMKGKILVMQAEDEKRLTGLSRGVIGKLMQAEAFIVLQKKLTMSVAARQNSRPVFEFLADSFPEKCNKVVYRVEAKSEKAHISQNVIGFLPGRSSDSCLVFTAHYDHLGRLGRETYFPGANDNASGTAMLPELAHYFAENRPEFDVVFMAFGAEEAGLIGSRFYTENPFFPLKKIKFLVNLDLVGTGDEGITVVNGSIFRKEFELLRQINSEEKLLKTVNERGKAANSDHYFFTEAGVPSFFIYGLGGISAYHDTDDRAESLPLTKFKEIFRLLTLFSGRL